VPAKAITPKRPDGRTLRARPRVPRAAPRSGTRRQAILDAGALLMQQRALSATSCSRRSSIGWVTTSSRESYTSMAASMPPMLRDEAFRLAAEVIPMRRWAEAAARPDALITMPTLRKAVNKWSGRVLTE
jgi:hypothetical protein